MSTVNEPNTTALAKTSPDVFLMFDRADDQRIVARVRGEALKECVYSFRQGGQMIYGLGIDGAEECKRELAKRGEIIREDSIDILRETPDEAYFIAKASRWAIHPNGGAQVQLDTTVELKRQEKYITKRDGSQAPNDFWLEQGGSKAMRNAILNLIPSLIKQQIIDAYKGTAKEVTPNQERVEGDVQDYHRKMDAKDERERKVAELRELWTTLQRPKAWVKTLLRERNLSDSLADAHVSWSTVDEAIVDELLAHAKKEAGK